MAAVHPVPPNQAPEGSHLGEMASGAVMFAHRFVAVNMAMVSVLVS